VVFMLGCPFQIQPECTVDADCVDQVCNVATGACVECLTDANCDQGLCSEAGGNICVECLLDDHCAAGEVCTNAHCVAAETGCTDDTDCAEGEVCTAGECVAGTAPPVGDPVAGEAFYGANGCVGCHAADATGGVGPNIQGESAAEIFARLSGASSHPVTVSDVTEQDSLDLEAWLGSL
jgi:Cys-rich repeat protein